MQKTNKLTILEYTFNVQPVCGTRLIVRTAFQIAGQFAGPGIINHARISFANRIYSKTKAI